VYNLIISLIIRLESSATLSLKYNKLAIVENSLSFLLKTEYFNDSLQLLKEINKVLAKMKVSEVLIQCNNYETLIFLNYGLPYEQPSD
jgi:hypothetical protein